VSAPAAARAALDPAIVRQGRVEVKAVTGPVEVSGARVAFGVTPSDAAFAA